MNPYSVDDLKKIQGILTFAIEDDSGKFRNHGEAVYDGDVQIFMAPPHRMVPELMDNLFRWMNEVKENGGNVNDVLSSLGITGIREADAIKRLSLDFIFYISL